MKLAPNGLNVRLPVVFIRDVALDGLNQACLPNSKRIAPEAVPVEVAPMFTVLGENWFTFSDLSPLRFMFPELASMSAFTKVKEWEPPEIASMKTSPPEGAWMVILTVAELLYPLIPLANVAELLFSPVTSIARPVDLLDVKVIGAMLSLFVKVLNVTPCISACEPSLSPMFEILSCPFPE